MKKSLVVVFVVVYYYNTTVRHFFQFAHLINLTKDKKYFCTDCIKLRF